MLELLRGQLSHDKLASLAIAFKELALDRRDVLAYFVLHHVCRSLAAALDEDAITAQRFDELTDGIAEKISDVLCRLDGEPRVCADELEALITKLIENRALFDSR